MTKRKTDQRCRRCGSPNDNPREYPSKRRCQICVKCEMNEETQKSNKQQARRTARYADLLTHKTCEHCAQTFVARSVNQKFCGLQCRNLSLAEWRKSNRTALKAQIKCTMCAQWFVRNSGSQKYCSPSCVDNAKKIGHLRWSLSARYAMSVDAFNEIVQRQGNACAICQESFANRKSIHVDHAHSCCNSSVSCGRCVRGFLCRRCNQLLGMAEDRTDILTQAVEYLALY